MATLKEQLFIPDPPQFVAERPINKGMILDQPSMFMPEGSLLDAKNVIVGVNGPRRRPSVIGYSGSAMAYPPVKHLTFMTTTAGQQYLIGIDKKFLYRVSRSATTHYGYPYTTGSVYADTLSNVLHGIGTAWTGASADLRAGDVLSVAGLVDRYVLSSVTDSTTAVLSSSLSAVLGTTTTYNLYRAIATARPYYPVTTVCDNKLIIADFVRPLLSFDGSTLTKYISAASWYAGCVEYFKDRLWAAHVFEAANDWRQRIVWSKTTDHTDFDVTGRYLDLPYTSGYIRRLKGLGNLLIAYFQDAVFFGRPTNIAGDTLPMAFERLETGGIGLVGPNAITQFLDGHFFVGQDDVYFLSQSGFQRIGTPVIRQMLANCNHKGAIVATNDPDEDRVVFGIPGASEDIEKIWSYNYKSKAWSYDEVLCTALAGGNSVEDLTWDSLTGTWDTLDDSYPSWDSMTGTEEKKFFLGKGDGLVYNLSEAAQDDPSSNIPVALVTRDHDEGAPDVIKTWTRLSIKLEAPIGQDLVLAVSGSTDRGATWTSFGNLTITAGDDEGFVNFLISGSTCRFKLSVTAATDRWRIVEAIRRVRGRGLEIHLGPSD